MDTSSAPQNTSTRPLITYNKGSYRDKFEGERKELLELAFFGQKEVKVEDTLSGYSGAQTWRVATDRGVFVVKLAHPTLIDREYQNYREHVVDHMHNIARLQGEPIKSASHEWALLKSTFARLRQSQTLFSYTQKKGSVDIAKILNDIFREYGEPWWGSAQNRRITCGVYYDRLLPAHLELVAFPPGGSDPGARRLVAGEVAQDQIADLEQDVINYGQRPNIHLQGFHVEKIKDGVLTLYADRPKDVESPRIRVKLKSTNAAEFSPGDIITTDASNLKTRQDLLNDYARKVTPGFSADHEKFTMDHMEYPNPIPHLQKLLDTSYDAKVSLIHGDLNLQNILVELDASNEHYRQHWLLDFSETGEGPVLLDLQWLEVQVITWLLAPEILKAGHSVNVLKEVFEGLHNFRELQPHLKAALQTTYSILQEIRGLAKGYLAIPNDWKEYYRGLVIGLIGALRFEQLEDSARKVAFLSAATVIRWTEELPSHLEGLPAQPHGIVIPPPPSLVIIDVNSLPKQILAGDKFPLRGGSRASIKVQIKANQISIATAEVDDSGRWQTEISFDKAGNYTLTAHDESAAVKSESVNIEVIEPPTIALTNLPEQVFTKKAFVLRGSARINAPIVVYANEKEHANVKANNSGRWQTSLEFDKAGQYEVRVQDQETNADSAPLLLTVLQVPSIESNSIPSRIFAERKFSLQGNAQPNVRVKLIANQQILATPLVDSTGCWQAEIVLDRAGTYNLIVRDESNKVESVPVPVTLLKSRTLAKTIGLISGATIVVLASVLTWYLWSKQITRIAQSVLDGTIALVQGTPTPLPPTPPPSTPTPPPTPPVLPTRDLAWGTTATTACAAIKELGQLTIGVSDNSGPYTYRDRTGKIVGFEVDLIGEVVRDCLKLDLNDSVEPYLKIIPLKVSERKEALIKRIVQVVIGSVSNTDDRCVTGELICTTPYVADEQVLAVRKGGAIGEYCDPDLSSVAVITGTTGQVTFPEYIEDCKLDLAQIKKTRLAPDRKTALQWVASGEIDAYKANGDLIQFTIEDNNFNELTIIHGGPSEPIGMWLHQEQIGLRALIDQTLEIMKHDGRPKKICQKYFTGYKKDCDTFPILQATQTLVLGSAIAGTGDNSPLARDQRISLEIALETANSKLKEILIQLTLEPREAGSDITTAVQAFRKLLAENVIAIIGPTYSFQLFGIYAQAEFKNAQVLVASTSATADDAATQSDFNLVTSAGVRWYAGYAPDAMLQENTAIRTVTIAYRANDQFTLSESKAFADGVRRNSREPTVITYTAFLTDSSYITKVVSYVVETQPDLFILSGLFGDGSKIIERLTQTEYAGKIIIGNALNTTEIFKYCRQRCDGIMIAQAYNPNWQSEGNEVFKQKYAEYYEKHYKDDPLLSEQPSQIMAQMYTAVQVIAEALIAIDGDRESQGSTRLRDVNLNDKAQLVKLREELNKKLLISEDEKITGSYPRFDTPLGQDTWFDHNGDIQQDSFCVAEITMVSDQEGEFSILPNYGINC